MKFENKIGGCFQNISQRVIYPYIISYPDFIPIIYQDVSEKSQEQIQKFLKETLLTIYNNPTIIDLLDEKDDCFNGEAFKEKPELNNKLKKLEKKFLSFFALLYEIGNLGELMDKKLFISKKVKSLNKSKLL